MYPEADTAIYARISLDRKDRTSVERQLEIGIAHAQAEWAKGDCHDAVIRSRWHMAGWKKEG